MHFYHKYHLLNVIHIFLMFSFYLWIFIRYIDFWMVVGFYFILFNKINIAISIKLVME